MYVTGKLFGSIDGYDFATIKYNSATGNQDWDEVYSSGNGSVSHDVPVGLAFEVDSGTGFIFVAGYKTSASNGKDFFSLKYTLEGTIAWVAQYHSEDDEATAMFMNATGLYLTGFNTNGFLTVKYTK